MGHTAKQVWLLPLHFSQRAPFPILRSAIARRDSATNALVTLLYIEAGRALLDVGADAVAAAIRSSARERIEGAVIALTGPRAHDPRPHCRRGRSWPCGPWWHRNPVYNQQLR